MAIPTHEEAMLPVLRSLQDGEARQRRWLSDAIADQFKLSETERAVLLPSRKSPVFRSRTGWALTYLKQAGLVNSPRRGWYELTERGRSVLQNNPKQLNNEFLLQFPEFQEFRTRSRSGGDDEGAGDDRFDQQVEPATPAIPPDEALEVAYDRLRAATEAELIETVRGVSPSFFEQLVIDLLVRMGYGGSREEAARAVGRSGDGGIDGVIDEDRLGLDVIYVQAKRWESSVGRPEIQKFVGALQGQRAKKGIFITTSGFTREAEEYTQRIDTRIVLVDGTRLAALMFEFNIGVSPRGSYVVKTIDGDYFEES